MNESNKGDGPVPPRNTLKLKTPRVKTAPKPETPPQRAEPVNWADDHKRRMQADMDALGAGGPAPGGRQRR